MRRVARAVLFALLSAACTAGGGGGTVDAAPLSPTDPGQFRLLLAASDAPVVVNVWASWCLPCRSEAPLLRIAHQRFGAEVRFVGLNVQDSQPQAAAFLTEFGLAFEQYSDPRRRVPSLLGGVGVPITYFFAPGGELVHLHSGVIDERTLALQIDELLGR